MTTNQLAPIALFVFNRPWHTRQTVEALRHNHEAKDSELFIFSDGAKEASQQTSVDSIRKYVRSIDGFKKIMILEQDRNLGLAGSIISGVTRLLDEYGRVVVLEDDIVTSPSFLRFLNAALDHYEQADRIMHVAGYMFPVKRADLLPETFFYRVPSCWGWGTWKRAWNAFVHDPLELLNEIIAQNKTYDFNIHDAFDFTGALGLQVKGKLDSWAMRWYASVFLQDGLCLHPSRSFVDNIGHDGSGIHCGTSSHFDNTGLLDRMPQFNDTVEESALAVDLMAEFYRSLKQPPYKTFLAKLLKRSRFLLARSLGTR